MNYNGRISKFRLGMNEFYTYLDVYMHAYIHTQPNNLKKKEFFVFKEPRVVWSRL